MNEGELKYIGTFQNLNQNNHFAQITEILNKIKFENDSQIQNQENLIVDQEEVQILKVHFYFILFKFFIFK